MFFTAFFVLCESFQSIPEPSDDDLIPRLVVPVTLSFDGELFI